MKGSMMTGISFGLTSAVITTLGLVVGLDSTTHSRLVVIGAILIIALADSFSDALGIHMSEEARNDRSVREIWESTFFTSMAKFIFTMSFIIPVLIFPLEKAINISIIYGLVLLGIFSFYIARDKKEKAWLVVLEHVTIAFIVVTLSHYLGDWIGRTFV